MSVPTHFNNGRNSALLRPLLKCVGTDMCYAPLSQPALWQPTKSLSSQRRQSGFPKRGTLSLWDPYKGRDPKMRVELRQGCDEKWPM